jgi:hypothetical protein
MELVDDVHPLHGRLELLFGPHLVAYVVPPAEPTEPPFAELEDVARTMLGYAEIVHFCTQPIPVCVICAPGVCAPHCYPSMGNPQFFRMLVKRK